MSKKSIVLFLNKEEHLIIKKSLRIFDKHYPDGKTIKLLSDITKIKKAGGEVPNQAPLG